MNKFVSSVLLATIGIALTGCESVLTPEQVDFNSDRTVILEVDESVPALSIKTSNGTNCRGRGCLSSPRNTTLRAKFTLYQSDGWHFSRFELCKGNNKASRKCDLTEFNRLEFAAQSVNDGPLAVPGKSGIIELSDLGVGDGLHEFFIYNQNSAKQNYYYRVQVCQDAVLSNCIWNEDPEWPNRGRGR